MKPFDALRWQRLMNVVAAVLVLGGAAMIGSVFLAVGSCSHLGPG